jgi:phage tail tape-measure protein
MEDIFNLPEKVDNVNEKKQLKTVDNLDETVDTDFKYARENLYNIIEKGSDALNTLVDVAAQSQHPRAFEVVSQLVKTLSDTNKDLLEIQKKVKVIKKDIPDQPQNVTNALFVGNTSELQKMINKRNNE